MALLIQRSLDTQATNTPANIPAGGQSNGPLLISRSASTLAPTPAPNSGYTTIGGQSYPNDSLISPNPATQPGQTFISQAPAPNLWDNFTNWFRNTFTPDSDKNRVAAAQNAYAVSQTPQGQDIMKNQNITLPQLAETGGSFFRNSPMEEVTKQLGIRNTATNSEFASLLMTAGIGAGILEAPVATIKLLGGFEAVNRVKSGIISAIQGEGFNLNGDKSLSDFTPNAGYTVKTALDVIDFLGTGALTGGLFKVTEKPLQAISEAFTRNVIEKYNLPDKIPFYPKQLKKEVFKNDNAQIKDFLEKTDTQPQEWAPAVVKNEPIEIPSEKMVKVSNTPYWEKLKSTIIEQQKSMPAAFEAISQAEGMNPDLPKLLIGRSNPEKIGGYLYHGTNEDVLGNISKEGLKPGRRGLLSLSKDEAYAKSFAREGITPQGKTNAVLLRVREDLLKKKTVSSDIPRPMSDQLNEVLTNEVILPESLEIMKNGKWVPLTDLRQATETVDKTSKSATVKSNGQSKTGTESKNIKTGKAENSQSQKVEVSSNKNKAPKPKTNVSKVPSVETPVGEGKVKESKLYKRVKDTLEEEYQNKNVTYNTLNLEKQARAVTDLVINEPERAFRVAKGLEKTPEGVTQNAVALAVAEQAKAAGDFKTYSDIMTSTSLRSTRLGQEIVSLRGSFADGTPENFVRQVIKERMANVAQAYKSSIQDRIKEVLHLSEASSPEAKAQAVISKQAEKLKTELSLEQIKIKRAQDIIEALKCK